MKKSTILLAAALTLAACTKQEISAPTSDTHTLYAQIEQDTATKTYIDEDNNIRWDDFDDIIAFMKSSYGHRYTIVESYAGKTYAEFTKVTTGNGDDLSGGIEWDHNVVFYPYNKNIECDRSGSDYILKNVNLRSWQTNYSLERVNNDMRIPMVAVSEDNDLTFRHACGGMKLKMKGNAKVTLIEIQGKNKEKLSGDATITVYTDGSAPVLKMSSTASETVTSYYYYDGIQLDEDSVTEFVVILPPVVFTEGFYVTVTGDEGYDYIFESNKKNTVYRASLLVMPEIELIKPVLCDYVDEYDINHGKGINVCGTIWAPVNCGYHKDDFKYGKLYQWGRKYGQGYNGSLYDADQNVTGEYSDAREPKMMQGGVSKVTGNQDFCDYVFWTAGSELNYDWMNSPDGTLWNSGSEMIPVKSEYDPCPDGWRVPTSAELKELIQNHSSSTTNDDGQNGYWFSGPLPCDLDVSKVFLPAAGRRYADGSASARGCCGYYWSSGANYEYGALTSYFDCGNDDVVGTNVETRAQGRSVRCVQVTD